MNFSISIQNYDRVENSDRFEKAFHNFLNYICEKCGHTSLLELNADQIPP